MLSAVAIIWRKENYNYSLTLYTNRRLSSVPEGRGEGGRGDPGPQGERATPCAIGLAMDRHTAELARAGQHNCVFLLQHEGASSIHQSPRNKLLVGLVRVLLGRYIVPANAVAVAGGGDAVRTVHGVVAVYSQREAAAVYRVLAGVSGAELCILEGHADIMKLRERVRATWKDSLCSQVFIVSSQCLLQLFCLGLWQLERLDFIVFDNVTPANKNHPYCILMEVGARRTGSLRCEP